jgi:hypothetical protein
MRAATYLALLGILAGAASADVLETRDGRMLEGVYRGGTERAIRFEVSGQVQVVPLADLLALTFTGRSHPAPEATPTPASAQTPTTPAQGQTLPKLARVPAGTHLRVRIADTIDPRQSVADDRFGGTLETGLAAGETPIVPVGTRVYGRIAEVRANAPVASRLKLELDQLMFRGQLIQIVSGPHQIPVAETTGPAKGSTAPERPGFAAGSLLEFRLLQPVELRLE